MPLSSGQVSSHYAILVSRAKDRPDADLLPFQVFDPIPRFRLPLQEGDEEPEVDLGAVLHQAYERAVYGLRIDYDAEPPRPAFTPEQLEWVRQRLADARTGRA